VCDLCYMLIVADQDLAKAEASMAWSLSIPEKKEENKMQWLQMMDCMINSCELGEKLT